MKSRLLLIHLIVIGDEILFIPNALTESNDFVVDPQFLRIPTQSSYIEIGRTLLNAFDQAGKLDIDKIYDSYPSVESTLGFDSLASLLKKCKIYSFAKTGMHYGENMILERGKKKRNFIEGIPLHKLSISEAEKNIEELGKKVRELL